MHLSYTRLGWIVLGVLLGHVTVDGQTSRIVPWQPAGNPDRRNVYHPNPILFVHGINTNDEDWGNDAIPALTNFFGAYDLPRDARALADSTNSVNVARYRSKQRNFLHTFNYGDPPGTNTINRQSFEPIMWNAWEHGDMA
jgi:pimeloyl-ACP methyl ester carboxylesterase